ncbi:hypothetical protein F5890DRAFT_1449242, partial [Lentinula detonsa]
MTNPSAGETSAGPGESDIIDVFPRETFDTFEDPDGDVDVDVDDDEGWEDMPIVRRDEVRGGLDEEDQRRYGYRVREEEDGGEGGGGRGGNATGMKLDTDEYGYRWRVNPMQGVDGAGVGVTGGSTTDYTRLRHVEEDWDESPNVVNASRYLFSDEFDDGMGGTGGRTRTAISQMEMMRGLLRESQRIGYVGLCRLVVEEMIGEVEVRGEGGEVKKEFREAVGSMKVWGLKIMGRLYYHIGLETREQEMIETLGRHGVKPIDLVPALVEMKEVVNPDSDGPEYITLDMRYTILTSLFLLLIADSVYDSRSRALFFRVGALLSLSSFDVLLFEGRIVEAVGVSGEAEGEVGLGKNEGAVEEQVRKLRRRRIAMLGLATLGGGLVIGLSAGLLAPVIGVGLGTAFSTIGIGGASTFLAGSTGAAVITTGGVLTGAGIAGKGMSRRTQVVRVFDVLPIHRNGRVGCVLSVPGFLNGKLDDPRLPFSVLDPVVGDVFSVLWEPEMIRETGSALSILTGEVLSQISQTVLQATVMATLMTALQWPIILTKLGYLIDNPWSNALDRARAAGLVLASILRERKLGVRPITLVGFSLGARVIFYALLDLARTTTTKGVRGGFGIVQDVYLMGATISVPLTMWEETRGVVGGRYVNVYARNDWVLNYLFRASSAVSGNVNTVAGLRPILGVQGLENHDVTDKIAGHMSYRVYMPLILEDLGFKITQTWFDEVEEEPDFEGDRERGGRE